MDIVNTDLSGIEPENKFKESFRIQPNLPLQIYILDHAPFFEDTVFRLDGDSAPLLLGTDYELVYRVEELKGAVRTDVYNGIKLNREMYGVIVAEGNHIGGGFYNPIIDAANQLLRYLNEPIVTSYNNVDDRPALFPPKPTYRPWFNITNKQHLASAVADTAVAAEESALDSDTVADQLISSVDALKASMENLNVLAHRAAKNPHNTTALQLNAHPINYPAADSALAYGYEVLNLVRKIRTDGLKSADVAKYIERYGSDGVVGTFDFADGNAGIYSEDRSTYLTFNDGQMKLVTDGVCVLRAGYTKDNGKFLEYVTGDNTLRFESTGNTLNDDKITLNGKKFITTENIFNYNPDGSEAQNNEVNVITAGNLYTAPTGKGTVTDPLKVDFSAPNATASTQGVVYATSDAGRTESNAAVSATATFRNTENLIPRSWRLNGNPIRNNHIIDKNAIGLGNVNNTNDLEKPLSNAQKEMLNGLSEKDHTHDVSNLDIDQATVTQYGVARIARTMGEYQWLLSNVDAIPSRLFGMTESLYNELVTTFYNNLPNFDETIDLRDLFVAAVSGATFDVNGKVLTVRPGDNFVVPTGDLKPGPIGGVFGEISGSVDLTKLPTNFWYSSACNLATKFPLAKPGNVIDANTTAIKPGEDSEHDVHGVKFSFYLENDGFVTFDHLYVDGYCKVYLDGRSVDISTARTQQTWFVEAGEHVIAYVCNKRNGVAAQIFYSVGVGDTTTDNIRVFKSSDEDVRFGYVPSTVDLNNGRCYLSVDWRTQKVVADIGYSDIKNNVRTQMDYLYIGHVDVKNGIVLGGKVLDFDSVIDFGGFNELYEHILDKKAHEGSSSTIIGLENVEPHGLLDHGSMLNLISPVVSFKSGDIATNSEVSDTAMRCKIMSASQKHMEAQIVFPTYDKSPAQFKSFKLKGDNLKKPVYEGCFQYYSNTQFNTSRSGLVFTRETEDGKTEILRCAQSTPHIVTYPVSLSTVKDFSHIDEERVTVGSYKNVSTYPTWDDLSGYIQQRKNAEGGIYTRDPIGHIAYRYNPEENTLLIYHKVQNSVDNTDFFTTVLVREIPFTQDVSRFFPSDYVGVFLVGDGYSFGTVGEHPYSFDVGVAASPFPIPTRGDIDYREYINYDELFKTYLSGSAVSTFAAKDNGMQYGVFHATPNEVNKRFDGMTGYFGETELGTVASSCDLTFPICILPTDVNEHTYLKKYPLGHFFDPSPLIQWGTNAIGSTYPSYTIGLGPISTGANVTRDRANTLPRKIVVYYDMLDVVKQLNRESIFVTGRYKFTINTNKGIGISVRSTVEGREDTSLLKVASATGIVTGYDFIVGPNSEYYDTESQIVAVEFTVNNGVDFAFKCQIWGDNGAPYWTFKPQCVEVIPAAHGTVYYTPWHITQRTWEWYCANAKDKFN